MFAVIKTGGKQYKVSPGDVIKIEKLSGEAGETLSFENVLMHGSGDDATVGTPFVDGAVVTGEILEQFRDKKVIAFKKLRRTHSRSTRKGHRQYLTAVRIKGIPGDEDGSKSAKARSEAKSAAAQQAVLDAADTSDDGHDKAAAMDKGSTELPAAKNIDDYTRPSNLIDGPVEDGDDLTKLPGLGEASQKQFNEMGVYYYRQFDEWTGDDWDYVEAYVETQLDGRVDVDRAAVSVQIKRLLEGSAE